MHSDALTHTGELSATAQAATTQTAPEQAALDLAATAQATPSQATPEEQPVAPPPANALASGDEVRVDTWLWAVRQTKSRSAATSAARAGHVKVNGTTAKASQKIRIGDEVRLRVEGFDRVLIVTGLLVKRVGAPQARACYEDRSPLRPRMAGMVPTRERGTGRPSKKERRELDRLRGRDSREHH